MISDPRKPFIIGYIWQDVAYCVVCAVESFGPADASDFPLNTLWSDEKLPANINCDSCEDVIYIIGAETEGE